MRNFSFATLKGRDIFLLTLVVLLLFAGLWYTFRYSAMKAEIDRRKTELQSLETQVQVSRAAVAQLPALQQEVARLEVESAEFLRALPSTTRMADVLGEIRVDLLAAGSDLKGVSQSGGQAANLPAGVRPIGINLNLDGTFSQMHRTLRSLEGMSRFSTINALSLNLGEPTSFDPTLTGQIGLTVYTFDPATANGSAAAGGAPGAAPDAAAAPAPTAPPAGGSQ